MGGGSDDFVNVWLKDSKNGAQLDKSSETFYKDWLETSSGIHSAPDLIGLEFLKKGYPGHKIVLSTDFGLNFRSYPDCICIPISEDELIQNVVYVPQLGRGARVAGLSPRIRFGGFKVAWDKYEFIWYKLQYPKTSQYFADQHYILYEGDSDEPINKLIFAAGTYANQTHNEIWVYSNGFWDKDHQLWLDLQKANWKDVILEEDRKEKLQKDVYSFFDSEHIYKELAIAWKRGIIMYGPPGNGKTISIKAIMKSCKNKGFEPLYVKNFKHYGGVEAGMETVFGKARELSPCVVVLEDLDALIDDSNRSFFLNQLDGIASNDGLLIIGTTNHFERLDPGLSSRPSRFDRKFLFDDPTGGERLLYVQYWQKKLESNEEINFPDSLANEIVSLTDKFSFAYLKEAFVNTLVILAGYEDKKKPEFGKLIKETITTLRKELGKSSSVQSVPIVESTERQLKIHQLLDGLSDRLSNRSLSFFDSLRLDDPPRRSMNELSENETKIRQLLDVLSETSVRRNGNNPGNSRRDNVLESFINHDSNPFM